MSILSVFVAIALAGGFFIFYSSVFATSSVEVIINEFVSDGNEWVELLNTTNDPINLEGWKLTELTNPGTAPVEIDWIELSGTIPANGILVFETTRPNLNNTGDSIGLYDNSDTPVLINRVTYGTVIGYPITAGLETGPVDGESAVFGDLSWSIDDSPTKGWFNDAGEPGKAPLLSEVSSFLILAGINSNIGELDNPSATPSNEEFALYFEKSGAGKIVFVDSLNLSNQNTVAVLQDLGEAMEMSDGHIAFDSETAQAMTDTGAKIYMYGLDFDSTPNIIVSDDDGVVIDPEDEDYPDITDISYDAETGTLTFDASHFIQFDIPVGIFGTKWNDLDGDGVRDWEDADGNDEKDIDEEYTEPGLAGWTIELSGENDEKTRATTDADGAYSFSGLEDGDYTVCEVLKSDWTQTYPNSDIDSDQDVSGDCDENSYGYEAEIGDVVNISNLDFGNVQKAHITVRKVAYLMPENGQEFSFNFDNRDDMEGFTLSDGEEQTFDVVPGDYTINENVPSEEWKLAHVACEYNGDSVGVDTSNGKTVTVGGGDTVICTFTNIDAGLTVITGYKWEDTNGNGEKNEGESARKDWNMALGHVMPHEDGALTIPIEIVALSLTGADGWYYLPVTEQGEYKIFEEKRDRWSTTNPSAIDSSFEIVYNTETEPRLVENSFFDVFIEELSGQTITGDTNGHPFDFGNFDLVDITGFKWDDKNGDGIWQKLCKENDLGCVTESGKDDVIMALGRVSGESELKDGHETVPVEIIAMDLTGANGDFVISNIGPGRYKLFEEKKSGWKSTNPEERADSFFDITYNLASIGDPDFDLLRIGDPDFDLLRQSFFDVFVELSGQNISQSVNTTGLVTVSGVPLEFGNHQSLVINEESTVNVGETSTVITWTTDRPGTSRVVYDTVSHPELGSSSCAEPNESLSCYGYANTTVVSDADPKVLNHSVTVGGLTSGTTYFFRTISAASPETVSGEFSGTIGSPSPTPTPTPTPGNNGGGGGNGIGEYINGPLANNGGTVAGATTTALPTPTFTPNPTPASSSQANPTPTPEVNNSGSTSGGGQVSPTPTGSITPEIFPSETPTPSTQPSLLLGNIGNIFGLDTGSWIIILLIILAVLFGAYWLIKRKFGK